MITGELKSKIDSVWNDFPWWQRLLVPTEPETTQPTATLDDYNTALAQLERPRDKAIVAVLWGCGLRHKGLLPAHACH